MAEASTSGPWYSSMRSTFITSDLEEVRIQCGTPLGYKLTIPRPDQRAHRPLTGSSTFFLGQFQVGLRFFLSPFFELVAQYFGIPLNQIAPNGYRQLCGSYIVFRVYDIPLEGRSFHFFFYPKMGEEGTFFFQSRAGCYFLGELPTSNRGWKDKFFYVSALIGFEWGSEWSVALSKAPRPMSSFRVANVRVVSILADLCLDARVLLQEGLLYVVGLSSVTAPLPSSFVGLP